MSPAVECQAVRVAPVVLVVLQVVVLRVAVLPVDLAVLLLAAFPAAPAV